MTVQCTVPQDKVAVVQISGRMDAASSPEFEAACEQALAGGATHLVVDLTDLQYVSSMGLRSFLMVAKQSKAKGGSVLLCGMKGFVKEVFDMTHVTSIFQLFDTTADALRSL